MHVNHRDEIAKNVAGLNDEFKHAGIELTGIPGAEVFLIPKIEEMQLRGDASRFNGNRCVLIELPKVFELAAVMEWDFCPPY